MKTKFLLLVIVSILTDNLNAQITFEKHYGSAISDIGNFARQTSDGGFIMCGNFTDPSDYTSKAALLKTNAYGDSTWIKFYLPTGMINSSANCVQQTPDGGFVFCGSFQVNYYPGNDDIYIVKTDANGDTTWSKRYGNGMNINANANFIKPTADGGYIIAAIKQVDQSGGLQSYLIKTDPSGDTTWTLTTSSNINENCSSVQENPDGSFIVSGDASNAIYLRKVSSTGTLLWTQLFGATQLANNYRADAKRTSDKGYILCSTLLTGTGWGKIYLLKTDSLGNEIWSKKFGDENIDNWAYSVEQTADSGYIIAGKVPDINYNNQMFILKTSSTGDSLWGKSFGTGASGASVEELNGGGFVLAGSTAGPSYGGMDFYLVRTDNDGNIIPTSSNNILSDGINNSLSVYPNPFKTSTTILLPSEIKNSNLTIYNIFGQKVKTINVSGCKINIDRDDLPGGIYFIRFTKGNKTISIDKLIITD